MPKNLVIVESPAKARTIARFLSSDYKIESSFGHIRDLPKNELGVQIDKRFEPTYVLSPDKQKIARSLKSVARGKTVWLASDEDREGEAIAWHVCLVLGLDPRKTKRIVFHEITRPAITEAVANPKTIDMKLVEAQQARRILDRLVGYELSPVLWKKVRGGLSAGRVQSVAVRLIVEREREIKAFKPKSDFKVSAIFDAKGEQLPAELSHKIINADSAKRFLEAIKDSSFTVKNVDQKPGSRSPSAPFTTSTLQQEAARKLGYGVRQTMSLAQRLYEHGHITYMRTDSTFLSPLAIEEAGKYIIAQFGDSYSQAKQYKTKNQSAQEAHEAIRPTRLAKKDAGADSSQRKLYELIRKRALASQMSAAAVEKTDIVIAVDGRGDEFIAGGEVLKFDGFLKVYGGGRDDKILPPVRVGQKLKLLELSALETLGKAPPRYSEASLVKKLENLGIGRPSTYAPTIGTIQARGYVEKKDLDGESREFKAFVLEKAKIIEKNQTSVIGSDRSKLIPTQLANIVTDFLSKHFAQIMDYDFTARAETELDNIALGELTWRDMLENFYKQFHPLVEKSKNVSRDEAGQARQLGKDPKSGQPISARYGRYGPVLQMGDFSKEKTGPQPRFAPLPEGASLESISLDQALPMFELPREVGKTKSGEIITADIGRFGPYIKVNKDFTSIKGHDPLSLTENEARKILAGKAEATAKKQIADFGKLKILRGPYGPYVTDGKKNAKIPKTTKPEVLSETDAAKLLAESPSKKARRR